MRRIVAVALAVVLAGSLGFGSGAPGWSSDGASSFSWQIAVQNPSRGVAPASLAFPSQSDPGGFFSLVIAPPGTTQTVNVNEAPVGPWRAAAAVFCDMPVVASQTFLWQDPSGAVQWAAHGGATPSPSKTWYLPEGVTQSGFESFLSIQNPSTVVASVGITYVTPGSRIPGPSVTVEPAGRKEVPVADTVPGEPGVAVVVAADVPVLAAICNYWNGGTSCATSFGATASATTWYLAEGSTDTDGGFETWILVQNPGASPARVAVSYLADGSPHAGPSMIVPPNDVTRFSAADSLPGRMEFSAIVSSDVPVVAAQAKVWDEGRGYDSMMGVPTPSSQWYFPVTHPVPGEASWLVLQNVGSARANVVVSYTSPLGPSGVATATLDSCARTSLDLPEAVDGQTVFSAVVSSDRPILALQGSSWPTESGTSVDSSFGATATSSTWYMPPTPRPPGQTESP